MDKKRGGELMPPKATTENPFHYLSLGAGVQSSTMLLMALKGEFAPLGYPIPDHSIFADTGWEPKKVYEWLEWLKSHVAEHWPKHTIHTVSQGNIREDMLKRENSTGGRCATIPYYIKNPDTGDGGIGRRQCTSEYKILPIRRKVRDLAGYAARARKPKGCIHTWTGISLDEVRRMKPSMEQWEVRRFPLIDARLSRHDCKEWMKRNGYPEPPRSACIGCPFHRDDEWLRLSPEEFADAVEFDKQIRKGAGWKGETFLHDSLIPLGEVDLQPDRNQMDLFSNECEGMCGV